MPGSVPVPRSLHAFPDGSTGVAGPCPGGRARAVWLKSGRMREVTGVEGKGAVKGAETSAEWACFYLRAVCIINTVLRVSFSEGWL